MPRETGKWLGGMCRLSSCRLLSDTPYMSLPAGLRLSRGRGSEIGRLSVKQNEYTARLSHSSLIGATDLIAS